MTHFQKFNTKMQCEIPRKARSTFIKNDVEGSAEVTLPGRQHRRKVAGESGFPQTAQYDPDKVT
jgi:hypothetical protein